LCEEPSVEFAT